MEKVIVLIRGISGSGKSTFAQLLGTKAICCADDYFIHDGKYLWTAEKLGRAHDWCLNKCRRYMKAQAERIVIANTLTTEREMKPYVDLAIQFGYKKFSIIVENRHECVNVHGVPEATLAKMRERFNIKL